MKIILSKDYNKDFINRIEYIDKKVYDECYLGTYESDTEKYLKNKDSYILLCNDDNIIIGYMSIFPIIDTLYYEIMNSDVMYDNNITPDQIVDNYNTKNSKLFIFSIAILPEYQNTSGASYLRQAFNAFIQDKNKNDVIIDETIAIAISEKGKNFLEKLGFEFVKKYNDNEILYKRKEQR